MLVLFNLLQQNDSAEQHIINILKPFPFRLGEAGAAS